MRLIDAEKLVEYGYSLERTYRKDSSTMVVERCKIKDIPVVDAVPVVRCKDCKHWCKEKDDSDYGHCKRYDHYARADCYCSDGERREDETND